MMQTLAINDMNLHSFILMCLSLAGSTVGDFVGMLDQDSHFQHNKADFLIANLSARGFRRAAKHSRPTKRGD